VAGQSAIFLDDNAAGTITFSGLVTAPSTTATAISLTDNTGATVNFTGGLDIDTTTGIGFLATGGGTVTVQGANNTIASGTGTALNVNGTTIGADDLTFQSISANGGTNGIVLNNTGSSGGLTVVGTGTANSGGGSSTLTTRIAGNSFQADANDDPIADVVFDNLSSTIRIEGWNGSPANDPTAFITSTNTFPADSVLDVASSGAVVGFSGDTVPAGGPGLGPN
jgi:hypothetical protein